MAEVLTESRSRAASGDVLPNRALVHWLLVLGAAAAALILGYLGLTGYLSRQTVPAFGKGWADVLFYDLQLFVFNAAPTQGAGPFPVALGIARFLAPATTVVATVETVRLLLSEQLRRWSSAAASNHAIVTGDSPVAVELARKLRAEYRKVVLVSVSPALTEQGRRQRLLDVTGDPTEPGTLRAAGLGRADALYACADRSTTNAATALRAREISQARGHTLITYAQVRDTEICTALRARRIGAMGDLRFRLEFFSVEDIAARVLLDKYPLAQKGERPAQVVIIGFGRLGRAVLREIARRPVPGGSPVTVRIRGESSEIVSGFLDRFPAIGWNCSVTVVDDPQSAGDAPTLIFVCLPDNDDALTAGLAAVHSLTARSDRVVICMSEPSPFGAVLTGARALLDDVEGRLTVFEVIEEACVPGRIREDLADQLARAIHQAYLDNCAARGDSPHINSSMRPWEELPEDLRHANLLRPRISVRSSMRSTVPWPRSPRPPRISHSGVTRSNCSPRWSIDAGCKSGRRKASCRGQTAKPGSTPTSWTGNISAKMRERRIGMPSVSCPRSSCGRDSRFSASQAAQPDLIVLVTVVTPMRSSG